MTAFWDALSEVVRRHREFAHTDWAMPPDVVARLERLADRFSPSGIDLSAALFRQDANLSVITGEGYEDREHRLRAARRSSVVEIFARGGIDAIRELAGRSELPIAVGWALGEAKDIVVDDQVLPGFVTGDVDAKLAIGYVCGKGVDAEGVAWLAAQANEDCPYSEEVKGATLAAAFPTSAVLELLEGTSSELQDAYWQRVAPIPVPRESQVCIAIGLSEHGRHSEAFYLLSHGIHGVEPGSVPFDDVERILLGLLSLPADEVQRRPNLWWEIGNILDYLEVSGAPLTLRARFEFLLVPATASTRTPVAINAALREDPAFFVEIVTMVYPPDGEDPGEVTDDRVALASIAYQVLQELHVPPGVDGNEVDGDVLTAWSVEVRDRLASTGRTRGADEALGRLLAFVPAGEDGVWPAEPVRELIEWFASSGFDDSLVMSRFRSTQPGGWMAAGVAADGDDPTYEAIGDRWYRTGAVLRHLRELNLSTRQSLDEARRRMEEGGRS